MLGLKIQERCCLSVCSVDLVSEARYTSEFNLPVKSR